MNNKNIKRKVDNKLFTAVKTLVKGGASIAEICEYLQISHNTVTRIRACDTYQDYLQSLAAWACKQREMRNKITPPVVEDVKPEEVPERTPEKKPEKDPDRTMGYYINNRIIEELKTQNEYLKLISAKLAYIVEQLS